MRSDKFVTATFVGTLTLVLGLCIGVKMGESAQASKVAAPWVVICEDGDEYIDGFKRDDPYYIKSLRCNAESSDGPRVVVEIID
jgi:hypothetical protein